ELERRVEPRLEGAREPEMHGEAEEVGRARAARRARGGVGRAVVDDQRLDAVEAGHAARQTGQRLGEVRLLVEPGALADELPARRERAPPAAREPTRR